MAHALRDGARRRDGLERIRARAADGRPYDLVLLDNHMPGMDGLGSRARSRGDGPRVSCSRPPARIARRPGFAATLSKPVRQSRLYDAIATAMRRRAASRGAGAAPSAAAPGGASILLAEDNPINQQVARQHPAKRGYRVDVVADGREAVDALRHSRTTPC